MESSKIVLTFKDKIALMAAKLALVLSPKSTSAPGLGALKISSGLLDKLLGSIPEAPVFVTGTNGKSTTAGILASIMQEAGKNFIHNRSGANLPSGLLTEIIKNTKLNGQISAQEALLEIDEAVLRKVTKQNPAKLILVNNFFRDQLDRFGEMEQTISLVQEGIRFEPPNPLDRGFGGSSMKSHNLQKRLILNCDDPNVCKLKEPPNPLDRGLSDSQVFCETKPLYFGIDEKVWESNPLPEIFAEELGLCPVCGADLHYEKQWLGQFGDFSCKSCGYKKPKADIKVTSLKVSPSSSEIEIEFLEPLNPLDRGLFSAAFPCQGEGGRRSDGVPLSVKIPLPGLFNVYNALGAASAAYAMGIEPQKIKAGIEKYKSLFGRSQEVEYKNKKLKIFLIKNPIGASEVLRLISTDPKAKVLLAINDNYADGRDVSWLWDAHFEYLANNQSPIYATGTKGTDIAVRLKYAGIEKINYVKNIKEAINDFYGSATEEDNLYLVPTYTALLEVTKLLGTGF